MDPLAHASIALMAKPLVPKAPLWALLAATQVPDLLSFAFMAAGIEHGAATQMDFEHGLQYLGPSLIPWSHGLFMSIVWSVMVAAIALLFYRDRKTSIVIGLIVFSHWVLDFIVYRYIPLFFDNSQVTGLGLITSPLGLIAGIVLETGLITGGITAYVVTRKRMAVKVSK
jgi:membrane-bound metal-dependent hydrolase YbcI (DUF457 family)